MKKIKLNNGLEMPQFGIGTFNVPSNEVAKEAIKEALKDGYRSIDTAHAYNDERGVGQGIKESGVPREEIWLTSKLWPSEYGEGKTLEAIDKMLNRLGVDYIDLLYVHQPIGDYLGAWKDMEKAEEMGKVRTLGISNFEEVGYEDVLENAKIKPAVLQAECHPYNQLIDVRKDLKKHDIALECWFPLGGYIGNETLFNDETIKEIASAHGKTPAQVILRWHIQEGFIVIPGATDPNYIKENIDIFDFELSEEEMNKFRNLNKAQRFFNMPMEELKKFVANAQLED